MANIKLTKPGRSRGQRRRSPMAEPVGNHWIYGHHAVLAAIRNPRRDRKLLLATDAAAARLREAAPDFTAVECKIVERAALDARLPTGSVHQGMALETRPLDQPPIETLMADLPERAVILLLDQVTDPHNVGAILRSAAAFGAAAVLMPRRHAPPETAALAKAASGALEHVPMVSVANLDRALQQLKDSDFWCVGLVAGAERTLADADLSGRIAIVLGAEGSGLRRLTTDRCDLLVRLPTSGPVDSLNVSNAAAVALYELARHDERRASSSR